MIDTLVYENKNNLIRVAGLAQGVLQRLDVVDLSKALEGNVYLGRITKKIELANGKTGYFVNIGDSREAFINAEEYGRDDLNANEGQEVVVQVAQEQRAEKGARLVRSLQFVGHNLVYNTVEFKSCRVIPIHVIFEATYEDWDEEDEIWQMQYNKPVGWKAYI